MLLIIMDSLLQQTEELTRYGHMKPMHSCTCPQYKLQQRQEDLTVQLGRFSITLPNAITLTCESCGHTQREATTEKNYQAAIKELKQYERDALGAELTRIRKKLRLTQQQAALLTGGGKNAFSRYENGEVKPVAAVINLFRLLDQYPEMLHCISPLKPTTKSATSTR